MSGKGATAYREQNHVPLIIKYPEGYRGGRFPRDIWCSSARLFDFILRALKIEDAGPGKKKDKLPVSAFLEASPTCPDPLIAVLRPPYKKIEPEDGEAELYKLEKDPAEAANLIEKSLPVVEELVALKALVSSRTRKIGGAGKGRRIDPARLRTRRVARGAPPHRAVCDHAVCKSAAGSQRKGLI